MGVQNLWTLLAPVGRQVEIESLAGQVLAVDASIWLTQFVKAMRDDEGNMIRNAHLLGTLYRVAKLLFYGVRPVFVFDGQTPEIKKRTTARRRKRQEQQTANLRHTAQRLLLNRLKQQRQEVLKAQSSTALAAAVAPGFTLPKARDARKTEEVLNEEKVELTNGAYDGVKQEATIEEKQMQGVWEAAAEFEEESGDLTLDDVELDTSRLSKIDLHAVFSLPPHLQKDMVQKILRDRRQEVRDQFIPLAGKPEKYSHAQISAFLQTSSLNRRIDAAKKQKRQEEMERQGGVGQGHRIDSNSNRFYIYQKDADHKEENGQDEDDKKTAERVDMTERSLVNERIQPREAQVDAFEVDRKGPSSTLALERFEHTLHDNAKEIAAALAARYQVRVKQEPVLAIERLRQSRLKKDKPSVSAKPAAAKVVAARPSSSDVSVELKLDEVDPEEMARFQKLFPACKTERVSTQVATAKSDPDDDDDDVEWEEAASSTVEQSKSDTLGPGIAE
ncbi:unnamed protein product [Hyaloperonospora brassicae]|uniref:XPG N-terminal domain-containing protein n=1 Tax=Hyaloperonospora brassicae TaxID=162125 RepID=A0AAV0U0C3_HYABA|nr:unnamed protein product [Hyaloperonospora brassicae]